MNLEQFGAERFDDDGVVQPAIAALLPRIHVTVRDELTAKYPAAWPTRGRWANTSTSSARQQWGRHSAVSHSRNRGARQAGLLTRTITGTR